ncbi:MAG TPA: NAD-dependent epimerase/dehydratase family protein [Planctomycetota bacterium]|nr:NAD-dependent epimerase/dehydratase family protein [Planctomycetota bacterium]
MLLAGCGYLGGAAARLLVAGGHDVVAVRRRHHRPPSGVLAVELDLCTDDLAALPRDIGAVVWSVAPAAPTADAYRAAYRHGPRRVFDVLRQRGDAVRRSVLISSTGVWERDDGSEVGDDDPPDAASPTGRELVAGEDSFRGVAPGPVVLRLGGIYGPGRTRLIDGVRSGTLAPPRSPRFTNRIHRDDGARAIVHALALEQPRASYIVVDDEPADLRDVLAFLAQRLGVPLPVPRDDARTSAGKRCRNTALRRSGWAPRYPSHRDGHAALLAATVGDP